jgi:hypothetical protein
MGKEGLVEVVMAEGKAEIAFAGTFDFSRNVRRMLSYISRHQCMTSLESATHAVYGSQRVSCASIVLDALPGVAALSFFPCLRLLAPDRHMPQATV